MENNELNHAEQTPEMPMKWHKFLISISLWVAVLVNLGNAGTYFSFASMYGIYAVCGAVMLALSVFSVVVRFALARFKSNGPKLLVILNICTGAVGIVFPLMESLSSGYPLSSMITSTNVSQMVVCFAMAALHRMYYGKRAHMFKN